jgi:hypothetical protein
MNNKRLTYIFLPKRNQNREISKSKLYINTNEKKTEAKAAGDVDENA